MFEIVDIFDSAIPPDDRYYTRTAVHVKHKGMTLIGMLAGPKVQIQSSHIFK